MSESTHLDVIRFSPCINVTITSFRSYSVLAMSYCHNQLIKLLYGFNHVLISESTHLDVIRFSPCINVTITSFKSYRVLAMSYSHNQLIMIL